MGISATGIGALATAFALQLPGPFHYDGAVARDGERWFALGHDVAGATLVPTDVRVRPIFEEGPDGRSEEVGVEVDSLDDGRNATVIAYLRGPALRAGPVAMARTRTSEGPEHLATHSIALGGRGYGIALRCMPSTTGEVDGQAQYRCPLVLGDGRTAQRLAELHGYGAGPENMPIFDRPFSILFAGDLDFDGRLDLLLELPDTDYAMRAVLLLSSQAAAGALVGEAAVFHVAGC